MMERNIVKDLTERYVYAVGKRLPSRNRQDIEEELRTLISDMLEDRCMGREPEKEDIEAVLRELGDPAVLAERYQSGCNYLIGPEYYPPYCALLKIVLPAVALAMVVVTVLTLLTGEATPIEAVAGLFSRAFSGVIGGFFWVTIIFVILERGGHQEAADQLQKGAATIAGEIKKGFSNAGRELRAEFTATGKELKEEFSWSPEKLPQLPQRRIKRGDIAVGLVFTLIILLLFTVAPEIIGAWIPGDPWRCIPLFNLEVLQRLLPLFYLSFGLSFLRDVMQLVEGEYTMRVMWVTIGCNAVSLLVSAFLFTRPGLFNADIISEIISLGGNVNNFADVLLSAIPKIFLAVLAFAFVLDTIEIIYRTLRQPKMDLM